MTLEQSRLWQTSKCWRDKAKRIRKRNTNIDEGAHTAH